jgi:CheY-like chemotaxis protein
MGGKMEMKKILVIDDEESVRKAFSLALEDSDYIVDTVESGEKGLEKYRNQGYDLIYLDLKMPGMNGVETLREIRKINYDVPVYIVTAFHQEFFEQLQSVQGEGISYELLNKPVNLDQIIMVTKGVLGE